MGQFDYDEDEKDLAYEIEAGSEQPAEATPAAPKSDLDAFLAQYQAANGDNSGVKEAEDSAKSKNMWTGIAQGLSTAFAGKDRTDSGFYDGIRKENDAAAEQARGDKKSKLADLWQKYQAQRQGKQDDQSAEKHGWDKDKHTRDGAKHDLDMDKDTPNGKSAIANRGILAKKVGVDPAQFEGMSYNEQIETARLIISNRTAAAGGGGRRGNVTPKPIYNPVTKQNEWGYFDEDSKRFYMADGSPAPTGAGPAYALGQDSQTGTSFNKTTGGVATLKNEAGEDMANVRTGLDVERAGGKASAAALGKAGVEADVATAVGDVATERSNVFAAEMNDLYAKAQVEGGVGPIAGRIATVKKDIGIANGPATDELIGTMQMRANSYIKEMTGAAATNPEFVRLLRTLPRPGQDAAAWKSAMSTWQADVARTGERLRKEAAAVKKVAGRGTPAPAASASVYPKTLRNADGTPATVQNAAEEAEANKDGFK